MKKGICLLLCCLLASGCSKSNGNDKSGEYQGTGLPPGFGAGINGKPLTTQDLNKIAEINATFGVLFSVLEAKTEKRQIEKMEEVQDRAQAFLRTLANCQIQENGPQNSEVGTHVTEFLGPNCPVSYKLNSERSEVQESFSMDFKATTFEAQSLSDVLAATMKGQMKFSKGAAAMALEVGLTRANGEQWRVQVAFSFRSEKNKNFYEYGTMVVGPEVKAFLQTSQEGSKEGNSATKVTIKLNGETVDEKTAEKYFRYLSPEFNNSGNLF